MKKLLVGAVSLALLLPGLRAGELGDPAAPLKISEWIKGGPVDLAAVKDKQVVVVEFWATWCPPCRTSIPHLTEMQKKFKDVIFVGVSDEKPDVVKKFVKQMGDKMDYVVAIDDDDQTSKGYMAAFDIGGIPHAFVVGKDGRILWQGHPMAGLEEVLDEIVTGKYDLAAAQAAARRAAESEAKREAAQAKLQELAQLIKSGNDDARARELEAELARLDEEAGGLMGGEKFDPADFRKRVLFSGKAQEYQKALAEGASAEKLAALEKELTNDAPKAFDLEQFKQAIARQAEMQKASPVLEAYFKAVSEGGESAKVPDLAKKVEALQLKNPELLNQIAWTILTEEEVKHRDLELATRLAKAGVDASGGRDPSILDTDARAWFDSGKVTEAVEQQKKAIGLADDEELQNELKATLKKYQDSLAAK